MIGRRELKRRAKIHTIRGIFFLVLSVIWGSGFLFLLSYLDGNGPDWMVTEGGVNKYAAGAFAVLTLGPTVFFALNGIFDYLEGSKLYDKWRNEY